jgi:hypothetical protein
MKRTLIFGALIAALGLSGWYVLNRYQQQSNSQQNTSLQTSPTDSQSMSPETEQPQEEKYLTIDEWDLRISYEKLGNNNTKYRLASPNNIYFYISELDTEVAKLSTEEQEAVTECAAYPRSVIGRISLADVQNNQEAPLYIKEPVRKIGTYGYVIYPPQAQCPGSSNYPSVGKLIGTYITGPFSEKRTDIINSFEEIN